MDVIKLLEADLRDIPHDTEYDEGFAEGIKQALFLIKRTEGDKEMKHKYIVNMDYRTYTFDERDVALDFAETGLDAAAEDVSVKILIVKDKEGAENE